MAYKVASQAKGTVCWVTLEAGVGPYYCYGDECSAWEWEPVEERKKHKDDITPRGYCRLLEERCRVDVD